MQKKITQTLQILFLVITVQAQNSVKVGNKGSYASYIPLYEAAKPYIEGPDGWGDKSQVMATRPIYVVDTNTRAIPTNDWWTDLLFSQYAGNMFAHPLMIKAQSNGIYVEYPRTWNYNGTSVESASSVVLSGNDFNAVDARARRWGDWTVDFILQNRQKDAQIAVTMGHGMPFVWLEYENVQAELKCSDTPRFFDKKGNTITLPFYGDYLGIEVNGDPYGLFLPENTSLQKGENGYELKFSGDKKFAVLGALPDKNALETYYQYAYAVPRDTKVSWNYNEESSVLNTTWNIITENLKGESNLKTIQGWIPHHYRKGTADFNFENYNYLTARGKMKCAIGNRFKFLYKFNGLIPYMPKPGFSTDALYKSDRMSQLIKAYANEKSGYGGDTYWGGKDLLYYSQYLTFAQQTGDTQSFVLLKNKLSQALTDWYTFTPGEQENYFASQPRWKTMLGLNASYGSDEFNDLHFHYGYFAYASGILAMFDEQFKADYGPMAEKVVQQYANWKRDNSSPFFRTFDIWEGHSWAGGVGDAWNGNGQESSSEAMQGWGGMFTLATALGDKEMRDAAIFGYTMESMGTAEYWFDRYKENIDYTKYDKPYNSNITGRGIGWWTWFSGDPVWMHSIQWLPISTSLKYLYEDTAFAKWDYSQMWDKKELTGWDGDLGNDSGLGNVILSYLQIFDADSAARVFDWLWAQDKSMVKDNYTGGISYYFTHAHRYLGEIQWDKRTNIPSSTIYYNSKTNQTVVAVYNPDTFERECIIYDANDSKIGHINVPARKFIVHKLDARLTSLQLESDLKTVEPNTNLQIRAIGMDQYGASIIANIQLTVNKGASITQNGIFSASAKGNYIITAQSGNLQTQLEIRVNDKPELTKICINATNNYVYLNHTVSLNYQGYDQYNDSIDCQVVWSVNGGGTISDNGEFTSEAVGGPFQITATSGGISSTTNIEVRLPLANIALLKDITVSSQENAGTSGKYLTDGDFSTRWSSAFTDPQWAIIDLGKDYNIAGAKLFWEVSYGKAYEIYITDDLNNWQNQQPVFTTNNSDGGEDNLNFETTGRYFIIKGLKRINNYGYSLWETEVYGSPVASGAAELSALLIDPKWTSIKDNETQTYSVKGYDQYGNDFKVTPTWTVQGSGSINTSNIFIPDGSGVMKIVAGQGSVSSIAQIYVEQTPKIATINFKVSSDSVQRLPLIIGAPYQFEIQGYNQFGVMTDATADWKVSGGGLINNQGFFMPDSKGNYLVFAQNGSLADTAYITIKEINEVDVALGKPAFGSSAENDGSIAAKAVDGDSGTRWSSEFSDPQWMYVDLQNNYEIYKIRLNWETAFGKAYEIQFSQDAINWETVYTETDSDGGEDIILLNGEARYVKLYGTERATGYGYSLYDFEVYASKIINNDPYLAKIIISPDTAWLMPGESKQFNAIGQDQNGNEIEISPVWNCSGSCIINKNGLFVAGNTDGEFVLTATVDSIIGTAHIHISDTPAIDTINVFPADTTIVAHSSLQFTSRVVGVNDNELQEPVEWSVTDGGTIEANGLFHSNGTTGRFTVFVRAGNKTDSTRLTIIEKDALNLAYQKPVTVSSGSNSTDAVDSINNTGWISGDNIDPQWLTVDLIDNYLVGRVKITWLNSVAKSFKIQVSKDEVTWKDAYSVYNNDLANKTNQIFLQEEGRYVRVFCTERDQASDYSIAEFEVFGSFESVFVQNFARKPISIYPNPVHNILNIDTHHVFSNSYQVTITDILGNVIYSQLAENSKISIDTQRLNEGVYLLVISDSNISTTSKFIINQ